MSLKTINIDSEVGEILPGLNSDYQSSSLNFTFASPFVYQQIYKYDHKTGSKKLVKEIKLKGSPQIVRNEFECQQLLVPGHDGV
jgi:protease II